MLSYYLYVFMALAVLCFVFMINPKIAVAIICINAFIGIAQTWARVKKIESTLERIEKKLNH